MIPYVRRCHVPSITPVTISQIGEISKPHRLAQTHRPVSILQRVYASNDMRAPLVAVLNVATTQSSHRLQYLAHRLPLPQARQSYASREPTVSCARMTWRCTRGPLLPPMQIRTASPPDQYLQMCPLPNRHPSATSHPPKAPHPDGEQKHPYSSN